MGCGLFNSKIILAGGVSVTGEEMTYNHGLVTYDTTTKKVAHEDFPNMRGRKVRPLVFEVSGRLYVLGTSNSAYKRSWEVFYPTPKVWARVSDPYCTMYNSLSGTKSNISGRTPYSWFICGPAFSISLPMDDLPYFHHARQLVKGFLCNSSQPLPFHGMAITYWNQGFSDVVVISFSQGLVAGQGRVEGRLLGYPPFHLIKPQFIFKTDCYEKPDGEVSSYFADWGNGKFCLTTFDNVNIHVYVFKLLRQEHADGTTSFVLKDLDNHKYTFNDFSVGGCTSVRLCGCFVLPNDDEAKRSEESKVYKNYFSCFELEGEDDDIPPLIQVGGEYKIDPDYDTDGPCSDLFQ
ncbi:hypothetical protein POM88_051434 [Heracleum sosnowskyi]|uniref:Uncharacterized protein n=1 Tax=Heracleum sosnowskyi TaxID=360622 RepID=A0AAD8H0M6_9APIA|nr:hypothetical protein POM88_051434 [Heracleum sosnowskyi]